MSETRLKTQCDVVLNHLREIGPIESEYAKDNYGIARLASRISTLKKTHPEIMVRMIKVPTRYGKTTRIAEYFIEKKALEPGQLLDVEPRRRW